MMSRPDHYPAGPEGLGYPSELSTADHTDNMGHPVESLEMLICRAETEPDSLTDEDAIVLGFFSSDAQAGRGVDSYAA